MNVISTHVLQDRQQMYTIGSLFYAIYFWFSFPMYFWMDEDVDWGIWQAIQSSLAAGMGVTMLLDFWRLAIGPIVESSASSSQLQWVGGSILGGACSAVDERLYE